MSSKSILIISSYTVSKLARFLRHSVLSDAVRRVAVLSDDDSESDLYQPVSDFQLSCNSLIVICCCATVFVTRINHVGWSSCHVSYIWVSKRSVESFRNCGARNFTFSHSQSKLPCKPWPGCARQLLPCGEWKWKVRLTVILQGGLKKASLLILEQFCLLPANVHNFWLICTIGNLQPEDS